MKMITLFLPEKYLEMLDTLVASNLYPNRSEALRMATWKFLHESVAMLKAVPATSTATASRAKRQTITSVTTAKVEPAPPSTPEAIPAAPADLDSILDELDSNKATSGDPDADPFDEIVREQKHDRAMERKIRDLQKAGYSMDEIERILT